MQRGERQRERESYPNLTSTDYPFNLAGSVAANGRAFIRRLWLFL